MDATIAQLEAKVARRQEDAELLRKENQVLQCQFECLDSVRKAAGIKHSVTLVQHLELIRKLRNVQEEIEEQKKVLATLLDTRKRLSCEQCQQRLVATRICTVIEEEEDENERLQLTVQRELERKKHEQESDQGFQRLLERHNVLQQRHIDDTTMIQQLEKENQSIQLAMTRASQRISILQPRLERARTRNEFLRKNIGP